MSPDVKSQGEKVNKCIQLINFCIEKSKIFSWEILASVLQQLVDVSPLPYLFMRLVPLSSRFGVALSDLCVGKGGGSYCGERWVGRWDLSFFFFCSLFPLLLPPFLFSHSKNPISPSTRFFKPPKSTPTDLATSTDCCAGKKCIKTLVFGRRW